jgi:hypothetical protein
LHEILERDGGRKPFEWNGEYERIEDVALTETDLYAIETLKAVGGALTEDGFLISVDRSPTTASMWWYVQCLEKAGMKISLSRSRMIECQGPSQGERFPLTVARRLRRGEARTAADEIVSLRSFKKLAAMKMIFQEDLADVIVRSVGPTEVMFEAICKYVDESGIRTLRLIKTPTLLGLHDFTNHGFHTASLAPLIVLPEVLQQCAAMASKLEAHCTVDSRITQDGKRWLERLDCPLHGRFIARDDEP